MKKKSYNVEKGKKYFKRTTSVLMLIKTAVVNLKIVKTIASFSL